MRVYKKIISDKTITAYNDSGVDWVVSGGCDCGMGCYLCEMRFKQFRFLKANTDLYARTMTEAMESYAHICDVANGKVAA